MRLLFICLLMLLNSCAAYQVHIVVPKRYDQLTFEQKVRFLGSLYEANKANLTVLSNNNKNRKINLEVIIHE